MIRLKRLRTLGASALLLLTLSPIARAEPAIAAPAANGVPATLAMTGIGLRVADLTRSLRFFRDGLGLREVTRFSTGEFDEIVLSIGDDRAAPPIFLLQSRDKAAKLNPREAAKGDKIILAVSDIAVLVRRLADLGYRPGSISRDAASGIEQTFVADPDGHRFEIIQKPVSK